MQPYDIESIVLGTVLRWGLDAARLVVPQLTPDKFVFGVGGNFGSDHSIIWQAIIDLVINKQSPTYANVATKLKGQYEVELRAFVDRLQNQYHIHTLENADFMHFADLVDKQGVVYNMASIGGRLHAQAHDVETFMHTTNKVSDIEKWATEQLSAFRKVLSTQSSGYKHVSTIIDAVKERWERQFAGEELVLPNHGFPSLMAHNLFPVGKIAVVHGLSSSGKSTLVFQVNLGTAIGLYAEGIPGCVAINSLEMEDIDLVERMVAILAHMDVSRFMQGTVKKTDMDRLFSWADFVAALPIFVDDTNFMTTSAMEYRASGLHVSEHGPVIQLSSDYGELFKDDAASEEQRVNHIFREQFGLSRLIGASVIAISQSTVDKTTTGGKSYIAGPDGTRYSRGILQAADIITELWNPVQMEAAGRAVVAPEGYSTAHPWLFVQKYRNGKAGIAIPLGWRAETTTFFDLSINQAPGKEEVYTHLQKAVDKAHVSTALVEPVEEAW